MKIYISADIEGICGVTSWDETEIGKPGYEAARQQMTADGMTCAIGKRDMHVHAIWRDGTGERDNFKFVFKFSWPRLIRQTQCRLA